MVLRDILAGFSALMQRGEMPQSRFSQDDDDPDDIDAWMARRNGQVALRPAADAAGRDLWNQAIQTGDDLYAGNPSDLTAIGLAALGAPAPQLAPASNDDDQNAVANRSLNPFATPIPQTASGAFGHELGIGANGGETLANIAGIFAAPEFAVGVNAARTFAATREANIAEMMGKGMDERTAVYLSKRYSGVDPRFYGARLPRDLNGGRGWRGNRLGLDRFNGPERIWNRMPSAWKDYYTGVASGDVMRRLPQDTAETPQ